MVADPGEVYPDQNPGEKPDPTLGKNTDLTCFFFPFPECFPIMNSASAAFNCVSNALT